MKLRELLYNINQDQHRLFKENKTWYTRAGRIIDQLESAVVGPPEGSKARQVLIKTELELEELLNSI